jgi:hypothetical protein
MKCTFHPEADAISDCRLCGKSLCPSCTVEIKGAPYCRECLESRVEQPPPAPALPLRERYSPRAAGWLSVLPGLGLAYLGQYLKAFTVALLFAGAIQFADHTDFGGVLVPLVWFGQIFYAVQEARRLNRASAPEEVITQTVPQPEKESPLWGAILIGIGTMFLLDQWELLDFGAIFEKFWPVLIIILGVQILLRGRRQNSQSAVS